MSDRNIEFEQETELSELNLLMLNSISDSGNFKNDEVASTLFNRIQADQKLFPPNSKYYEGFILISHTVFFINNRGTLVEQEAIDANKYMDWLKFTKSIIEKGASVTSKEALLYAQSCEENNQPIINNSIKSIIENLLQTDLPQTSPTDKENTSSPILPKTITFVDKLRMKIKSIIDKLFRPKNPTPNSLFVPKSSYPHAGIRPTSPLQPPKHIIEKAEASNQPKSPANRQTLSGSSDLSRRLKEIAPPSIEQPSLNSLYKPTPELIVVSDLHGNLKKWQCVKKRMQKNPAMHLIILGDAMDRGDYGLEILLQIRELCLNGRATYIPGNHDEFAYDYLSTDTDHKRNSQTHTLAKRNWESNGGKITMDKFAKFDKIVTQEINNDNLKKAVTKDQLIEWLGNCPLQIKVTEGNIPYAIAHAMFQNSLYEKNPKFCLGDALKLKLENPSNPLLADARNVLWYRENNPSTHFADISWPTGSTVIVGHTPQHNINLQHLKCNAFQPVIYLDCGNGPFLEGYSLTQGKNVPLEEVLEK